MQDNENDGPQMLQTTSRFKEYVDLISIPTEKQSAERRPHNDTHRPVQQRDVFRIAVSQVISHSLGVYSDRGI